MAAMSVKATTLRSRLRYQKFSSDHPDRLKPRPIPTSPGNCADLFTFSFLSSDRKAKSASPELVPTDKLREIASRLRDEITKPKKFEIPPLPVGLNTASVMCARGVVVTEGWEELPEGHPDIPFNIPPPVYFKPGRNYFPRALPERYLDYVSFSVPVESFAYVRELKSVCFAGYKKDVLKGVNVPFTVPPQPRLGHQFYDVHNELRSFWERNFSSLPRVRSPVLLEVLSRLRFWLCAKRWQRMGFQVPDVVSDEVKADSYASKEQGSVVPPAMRLELGTTVRLQDKLPIYDVRGLPDRVLGTVVRPQKRESYDAEYKTVQGDYTLVPGVVIRQCQLFVLSQFPEYDLGFFFRTKIEDMNPREVDLQGAIESICFRNDYDFLSRKHGSIPREFHNPIFDDPNDYRIDMFDRMLTGDYIFDGYDTTQPTIGDLTEDEFYDRYSDVQPQGNEGRSFSLNPLDRVNTAIENLSGNCNALLSRVDPLVDRAHALADSVQVSTMRLENTLHKLDNGLDPLLTKALEFFESTKECGPSFVKTMSDTSNNIQKCIESIGGVFSGLALVVPMIAAIALSLVYPMAGLALAGIGGVIWLRTCLPKDLWSSLEPYFRPLMEIFQRREEGEPEAQGLYDTPNIGIGKIVAICTMFYTLKDCLGSRWFFSYLLDKVSSFDRTSSGWGGFLDTVVGSIEYVINQIGRLFGSKKYITLMRSPYIAINSWRKEVNESLLAADLNNWPSTPEELDHLVALRQMGATLLETYKYDKESGILLNRMINSLHELCVSNGAAFANGKSRPEPIAMVICGDPGLGKSTLLKSIATEIVLGTLSDERLCAMNYDCASEIFQKGESPYWEGYNGQSVYCMDDVWQATTVAGQEKNDTMEFIRCKNSWPLPLNMANLNDKGKKNFSSKAMFLTTNQTILTSLYTSVHNVEAVARRFDFAYRLGCEPGWTMVGPSGKPVLNVPKVEQWVEENGTTPWHAWHLIPWDYMKGTPCPGAQKVSLVTMMRNMISKIKSNTTCHNKIMGQLKVHTALQVQARNLEPRLAKLWLSAKGKPSPDLLSEVLASVPSEKQKLFTSKLHLSPTVSSPCTGQLPDEPTLAVLTTDQIEELYTSTEDEDDITRRRTPRLIRPTMRRRVVRPQGTEESDFDVWDENPEYPLRTPGLHNIPEEEALEVETAPEQEIEEFQNCNEHFWPGRKHQADLCEAKFKKDTELSFENVTFAWKAADAAFVKHVAGVMASASQMPPLVAFLLTGGMLWGIIAMVRAGIKRLFKAEVKTKAQSFEACELITEEDKVDTKGEAIQDPGTILLNAYVRVTAQSSEKAQTVRTSLPKGFDSKRAFLRSQDPEMGGKAPNLKKATIRAESVETWTQSSSLTLEEIRKGRPLFDFKGANIVADHTSMDIAKSVANNVFEISAWDGERRVNFDGILIMLRGQVGMMPRHSFRQLELAVHTSRFPSTLTLKFQSTGSPGYIFSYSWKDISKMTAFEDETTDFLAIHFRIKGVGVAQAQRDIVDKFICEGHVPNLKRCVVRMETRRASPIPSVDRYHGKATTVSNKPEYQTSLLSDEKTMLERSLEYSFNTKPGQCGSLVFLSNDNTTGGHKIIGFHVAGTGTFGWSNIITQQYLEEVLSHFDNIIKERPIPEEVLPISDESFLSIVVPQTSEGYDCPLDFVKEGSFQYLGTCAKPFSTNSRSAYVHTALKNAWGVDSRRPATLKPFTNSEGVLVEPMRNALANYDSAIRTYDSDLLQEVSHTTFKPLFEASLEFPRDVLTFEEAVQGCPRFGNFPSIARGKSPGYPYNLEAIRNKKYWFGDGNSYDFENPRAKLLKSIVLLSLEDAKQGIRNFHVYTDFLKDELRTIAKVKAGKTRLISGAPLVYTIMWRMYFGAFMSAVQHTRIVNGIAVGVDPHSEWHGVVHHLTRRSRHFIAGDFKFYDASCQPQYHDSIRNTINKWYDAGPIDSLVREVLWLEVSYSRHLGGTGLQRSVFYTWNKCLPSGHPATSIINSMYNIMLWVHAWFDIEGPIAGPCFWDYVTPLTYGDDNIVSVHENYIKTFNQHTVVDAFARLGFIYTNEDKNEVNVDETRPITEISFLKRSFYHHDILDTWVAPLSLDTVLYIPYWCATAARIEEITRTNLETCLAELSLHPPEVWDRYAGLIMDKARTLIGYECKYVSREYWARATRDPATWL